MSRLQHKTDDLFPFAPKPVGWGACWGSDRVKYDMQLRGNCHQAKIGILICMYFRAEVVEWLIHSTAVREVACSVPAEGIFSETLSPA